jgi:hypothetical protein
LNKIEQIIEQIELEFIEFVERRIEDRKKLLPLTDEKQIKALIWNLLSSEKWRKQISYTDYSKILDVWFERVKNKKEL